MEEKNELNDIILSKGGSNSNRKKLLLAIAALTLILIIVLVIMNSLKSQTDEKPPQAVVPPVPTAPTETAKDPLFEPVEVIQEGSNTTAEATTPSAPQDLGAIAQKSNKSRCKILRCPSMSFSHRLPLLQSLSRALRLNSLKRHRRVLRFLPQHRLKQPNRQKHSRHKNFLKMP